MKMIKQNGICIAESQGKGRGVFALKLFLPNDTIEVCPILKFENERWDDVAKSNIRNYAFAYDNVSTIIALGYGSLYNHSYSPNAYYVKGQSNDTLDIVALARIAPGQEIFINYNSNPYDKSPLWFETN
jgi:uncharacterized protein